ncbi:MAG: SDR family NAD(P)-dependent oxidoreductase [Candidatus Omnitrophota bacterium]|jgi:dihydroflavonol-4-reductase
MIVVTGANGFIGSRVVRQLIRQGERVRCFVRRETNLINLEEDGARYEVEMVCGDVRDYSSVRNAVKDARAVYHMAAYAHLWYPDVKAVYDINWKGSKNVFQACLEEGVEKVVYTNTAAIMRGGTKKDPGNEDSGDLGLRDMPGHYTRSKFLAFREALNYSRNGLPVTIVSPTTPVGDGDFKPTPPGKMIIDYLNGKLPAYIGTVLNYIDVDDAAAGHISAEKTGRLGERYILGAYNLTLEELFAMLEKITGIPAPRVKLPVAPLLPLGFICGMISENLTHTEPPVPWEGLRLAAKPFAFDSSKAVRELGLPQGDIETALRKAVDWFRSKGYVKTGGRR